MRIVWCCGAGCSAEDVRAALESRGADPSCLGRYGLPGRAVVPGMRVSSVSPGIVADAKRYQAILKLPGAGLNGKLYRMCVQAISEGDGDLPRRSARAAAGQHRRLLRPGRLAPGLGRYKYRLFGRWLKSAG